MVEGTVKAVPEIFYQLYIIHVVCRDHVVPVIYTLLQRKNLDTSQCSIEEIYIGKLFLDFVKNDYNQFDYR